MVRVVFDEHEHTIKIDSEAAKAIGKFGTSLLYQFGQFNFHPRAYEVLNRLDELRFRPDDVVLTMFPKSGSTWLSECIYLVVHHYNYELALKESIEIRFPQIDSPSHDVFDLITNSKTQRLVKASIPPGLLIRQPMVAGGGGQADMAQAQPPQLSPPPKVISIFRNPRDVLVSFYHHCKTVRHYDIDFTFDMFFDSFVNGKVPCGPIWLLYNETYRYYQANRETTMLLFYEDMKRNLREQMVKICRFLGKPEPEGEDGWSQLLDHLSVQRMRQNPTINRHDWDKLGLRNPNGYEFVRKGQVNDWKNFFNEQQSIQFDREITAKLIPELRLNYGPQEF